jgi:Transposase
MKRSTFSEQQVALTFRQAEGGTSVRDVCRQLGLSEATFYVPKKKVWASGRERLAAATPARGGEQPPETSGGGSHARQTHSDGDHPNKPVTPTRRGERPRLDGRDLPDPCAPSVSAGGLSPIDAVQAEQGPRSVGVAAPNSGACPPPPAVWVSPGPLPPAAAGRLAREQEARVSVVLPPGPAGADAGAAAEAHALHRWPAPAPTGPHHR